MAFQHEGVDLDYARFSREGNAAARAVEGYQKIYGRAPTKQEIAAVLPVYLGSDKNIVNVGGGDAYVAQLFQQYENTPEKLQAKEQAELGKKAPEHYGSVDELFQGSLGRTATQEEKDHFGKMLASGQLDKYQLGQFVNQLPENIRKQDAEFRTQIAGELQGQDQRYFSEQVMPGIQSNFAKQGRSVDSSGFANSLAQAANQQNRQRESFLSNLSAQQYGGSQQGAREDYLNTLGRYQGFQDYGMQRRDSLMDANRNRLYEIEDFNQQKMMYDDYLRRYGKSNSGIGGLVGGAVGAGAGAFFGGPAGASAGYGIGSGFGNAIGGM